MNEMYFLCLFVSNENVWAITEPCFSIILFSDFARTKKILFLLLFFFSRQTFDEKAKVLLNIDPLNNFFEL